MDNILNWESFNENSNSVGQDLEYILLEVNDEPLWKADCWLESKSPSGEKWIVIINTIDEDEEYELEGQNPPVLVVESIKRLVDFMNISGFINYEIMYGSGGYNDFLNNIDLEAVSGLDVWPDEFIRIEFWK
jgi:hypothetical protein